RASGTCSSSGKSFSRRLIQRQPAARAEPRISGSGRRAWRRSVTSSSGGAGSLTSPSKDLFEEPRGGDLGFGVGALLVGILPRGEAVLGAAVEIELERNLGAA